MMKIGFLDFWHDFDENNNFFYHMLSSFKDNVVVTSPNECDVLFFSCYGSRNNEQQFQSKKRIFYTGENLRPVFDSNTTRTYNTFTGRCDFSLSFDFDDYGGKNIRLPLWLLQIDWYNKVNFRNPQFMIPYEEIYSNRFYNKPKEKFCSIVFNSTSPHRYEIIAKLSKYKAVDCFGKPFGNWSNGEDVKLGIISDYKFNICFENTIHIGYYTEKPIHAKVAGCIPIYWSDHHMSRDFNEKAFINLSNFDNLDALVDYVIEVDKDDSKYNQIRDERIFNEDQDPKAMFDKVINKIKGIL